MIETHLRRAIALSAEALERGNRPFGGTRSSLRCADNTAAGDADITVEGRSWNATRTRPCDDELGRGEHPVSPGR